MAAPEIAVAYVSIVPEIQGFARQLRQQLVGPADDAGGQAGDAAGSSLRDRLKVGAAAAGVAAGALLAAGIVEAIDHSKVKTRLNAQLGATGADAGKYGKIAGKLYSSGVSETFQDAADAIKAVVQNGLAPPGTTNKQLQSIATKAADVANVFDQDLGGVTRAVSQMLRTGMASSATEAFDVLTKGFQNGANSADDLLDTFSEYSTQFRKLGLDGKQALGLITQMVKAGARDSDVAADALKEFSIRAVDMSKTSQDAYKALGLDAEKMSLQIAKGGDSASGGLAKVIERLKAMKDPVDREAAAVGLFGTQAEDLGAALLAMDPNKAVSSLGKVGGAADRMGKTLRSGPAHEIEMFTRTLRTAFVDVVGKYVIPGIRTFVDVVRGVASAVGNVVSFFREWGPVLAPIGAAIAVITVALKAQAIATWLTIAAMNAYAIAVRAVNVVTRAWAAGQALLNAVMRLNPVVLVVTALLALGAALVLAYKKSETFRAVVQAAWNGIKTAALYVWNNVLKPAFAGMMTAFRAVGTVAMWLWNNAIKPAFGFISTAARILLTTITVVVIAPIVAAVKILGAIFRWLWVNAIKPAVDAIGRAAMWLWNNAIKPAFGLIRAGIRALGAVFRWLYNNIFKPVSNLIGTVIRWVYNSVVRPVFDRIKNAITLLGAGFRLLYNRFVKPAFDWVADKVRWVWNKGIKPPFDAIKRAVKAVGDAFSTAKDYIGRQWSKLASIAKKPIQFVVDTVYNKGIVGVWNAVAGAFGAPKLKKFKFASGGILPGYTPGRDPHRFWSPTGGSLELSGGEAIMRPEVTRALGVGTVNSLNAAARSGGVSGVKSALGGQAFANGGVYKAGPVQRFAKGGIWGWIGDQAEGAWDAVKKGASWLKDGIKASALAGINKLVKPLINKISGDSGLYTQLVKAVPTRMVKSILGFSETADKKLSAAGVGGKGTKSALRWARTQHGKRYQWGGNGNPSWDCSGFMSAIESVIRGQRPHRRWATMAFRGAAAPSGWVRNMKAPFMVGITNAGVGHTAGTLNGVNVESRGGDGVVVGPRARSYRSSLFPDWYGFAPSKKYDQGGWLQPGATMSVNATGKPEPILTASQWADVSTLAARGADGVPDGTRLVLVTDGGGSFEAYVDRRADDRIHRGLVEPAALGRTL